MKKIPFNTQKKISVISVIIIILSQTISAQTARETLKPFKGTPRHYVCQETKDKVVIDGKLEEAGWQQAPWTDDFQDIEGDAKPAPALRTRAKMMWDQQYLYIAATLQEPHIWGTLTDHDAIIFRDNDFEVFIDPDGDTHQYYEIEINALNTVMDLFMGKPYRNMGEALINWDTKGIITAIHINGTINNPSDTDKEWTVEMAIPFSALSFFSRNQQPAENSLWRINFSRVEWDTDIKNGKYVKLQQPEHNWVWSPQGIVNMHAPERWGYLLFTSKANTTFQLPPAEEARQYLWQIYSAQLEYRQANGRYAGSLKALKIPEKQTGPNGQVYTLKMEGISLQYNASVTGSNFTGSVNINQEGKVYNNRK
ncbi:carbohydrate-binding family 9-like protein [Chitinophaga sp.]|uniref:carbohydrate-binding family 9-like protein n=1 Tax=Chitinophaga sp. TaxID=1869181 RepID=UPI002C90B9AA|nr:carbohydrate-binding family 9-like protein [Chitinophaga sp.]HWV64523.1 carbohydrate-binding family 9-like protein [Chitinophaga sp.]